MNINRIEDVRPAPDTQVTLKRCGNVYEIRYMHSTPNPAIEKLDRDTYIDLRTGEIKSITHSTSRKSDLASVAQSLRNLRDLINSNLTDPDSALWVTFTYAENMRDTKQLYEDFRRFWLRFRYYLDKQDRPAAEYIIAAEPQGRGAWHLHGLFIFPEKAPFIPNGEMEQLWRQGFTKTKSLSEISNPGLYLTAYLGDMEITEALTSGITRGRLAETNEQDGKKKAVIKGARLHFYPVGFHLYRASRGVKRPVTYQLTEAEAQMMVKGLPLAYEKTISITDESGSVRNIINYRQYNRAVTQKQENAEAKTSCGEKEEQVL